MVNKSLSNLLEKLVKLQLKTIALKIYRECHQIFHFPANSQHENSLKDFMKNAFNKFELKLYRYLVVNVFAVENDFSSLQCGSSATQKKGSCWIKRETHNKREIFKIKMFRIRDELT